MSVPSASCTTAWFQARGCSDELDSMSCLPSESYTTGVLQLGPSCLKSRCGAMLLSDLGDLNGLLACKALRVF